VTAESTPLVLNVIVTEHGVNMGDHGEDVSRAVDVDPDTTLRALMESVARKNTWRGLQPTPEFSSDFSVTIRAALPLGGVREAEASIDELVAKCPECGQPCPYASHGNDHCGSCPECHPEVPEWTL
jgi:hypothetical protein